MGARAVSRFGKVGGAGAVGSEGDDMAIETTESTQPASGNTSDPGAATREQSVIAGGPGAGEQSAPVFKVKYKDKEFNSEAELTTYLDQLGTEITTLKARPIAEPTSPTPAVTSNGPDPKKAKKLEEMTDDELVPLVIGSPREMVTRIKSELREEYQTVENNRRAMEKFWVDFWNENKELKPFENVVRMVMDANMRSLAPMTMTKAAESLADLSRKTVMTINKDAFEKPKSANGKNRAIVEGAGTSSGPAPKQEQQEQPQKGSLTAMIKKRQAARAAASTRAIVS